MSAIALSNHGGRQLDDAPTSFPLVPRVRDAVGDRVEITCDGGVRRGSDIVKAVAAGADAARWPAVRISVHSAPRASLASTVCWRGFSPTPCA